MADPNDPNSTGGNWGGMFGAPQNDPWSNLMLFGASMAAAGSQPGATFAGSVGKGFLGGYQASQNAASNQSEIGLRRAQTQNVGIEARQKAIGLNMQIQQMNFMRSKYGLPPLDQNGQPIDSTSSTQNTGGPSNGGLPVGQPSSGSAGVSKVAPQFTAVPTSSGQDASVGSSPIAAMAPNAQPSPTAALSAQPRPNVPINAQSPQSAVAAAQPPQPQPGTTPGPFEIPQEVWVGTMAPTKRQAGVMSGVYGMMGDQNNANFYRDYAMKTEPGFQLTPGYGETYIPNSSADPRYKGQVAGSEARAQVQPHIDEAWGKPMETRPGNVIVRPSTGTPIYQNPVAVERIDSSGRKYTDYVTPGMVSGQGAQPPAPAFGGGGAPVAPVAPIAPRAPLPLAFRPQAPGQAAPPASVAGPPPAAAGGNAPVASYLSALSPGEMKEQEARGTELGQLATHIDEQATSARQTNFLFDQMRQESNAWAMGKFADVKNDALAYAHGFAKTFGFDTSKNGTGPFADLDDRVGDFQSFVKNAGQLARAATKEVSSRAAFQELTFINNTLPSPEMSAGGFQRVADQMQSVNDYALGRQAAAVQWKAGHGTLEGFDASFNQSVSPGAYLLHRMSVPDAQQFFTIANQTDSGRAMVGRLVQQMKYATANKLFVE
jgi:hypothetical protein